MKTDITLSPMVLLKRGVQVAVDCVNNPISNYKFSLLDFNSKTEHNSILKTICNKIDYKVLLNTTYRQIKFFAAELSADITSDAVWATVRRHGGQKHYGEFGDSQFCISISRINIYSNETLIFHCLQKADN